MTYDRLPLTTFQAKYAAFPTLTEPSYDAWATDAESEIGESYGDLQQKATELLTAHFLASQGIGLAAGAATLLATGATSFKSGTFSASIAESVVTARAKGGLASTSYGQELQRIKRRLFGGPFLAGCA
jgi:hypothetical protein